MTVPAEPFQDAAVTNAHPILEHDVCTLAPSAPRFREITVRRYHATDAPAWEQFLTSSSNGTLFHSLDFLAYHSPERFEIHHLMFERSGKLLALLPAAVVSEPSGRRILKSPYGGSVGGFVLPPGLGAVTTLGLVDALKHHATAAGL